MNAVLRKVSPLRSAFRSEAKRIMQVSKLNKHVFLSTSSLADPTGFVVSVIHIQWNVTFKITNICVRKPQQLKNKQVIYLSVRGM